jgi:rare lipoprotein A (peptidoglycan hydrolase)
MSEKKDGNIISAILIGWILVFGVVGLAVGARWQKDRDLRELTARKVTMEKLATEIAEAKAALNRERVFIRAWTGIASWYGKVEHGRKTANQETFDMNAFTAAHPTAPFNSIYLIENTETGKWAVIRINDRLPKIHGREIDVSYAVAKRLGMLKAGLAAVCLYEIVLPKGD